MKDKSGGKPKRARFLGLYLSLRADLLRFAFWLSGDQSLAEDGAQKTLRPASKAHDSRAQQHELANFRAALRELPRKYREPLVLQVLMGYSTEDIAAKLDLSHAAVLTLLFRGRKQLRALCCEDADLDPEQRLQ
jgi:DNA-directed RNA polymerase specialized sigma24 family protein